MNVITPVEARHPFLTGKAKRLFIDGKWVEAASGKTFETHNPSTGEVLAAWRRATRRTSTARSRRRGAPSTAPGASSSRSSGRTCC